jgi:DeoR family suf operon transcriptional repressor
MKKEGDEWQSFPTESRIIMALKESNGLSLGAISERLGISKMAVLKHLQSLERREIVERRIVKKNIGRPYYTFHLLQSSSSALGSSSEMLLYSLLDFLVERGSEEIVINFLRERYKKVEAYYEESLRFKSGRERVEELAKLRYLENYFPELKNIGRDRFELLEYNCPIYAISRKFGEACSLEQKLFENVLKMEVNTTHTQVNGHGTCRFLISKSRKIP